MQIETTMRRHLTPVRMAIIKNKMKRERERANKRWRGCGETGTLYAAGGNTKWHSRHGKHYEASSKIKNRTTIRSSNTPSEHLFQIIKIRISKILCTPCSLQCYSQQPRYGNNRSFPSADEWVKEMQHIHIMDIIQPLKRRKFCSVWQHGWTLRTLCKVKSASHRSTDTAWLRLYEGAIK